MTLPSRMIPSEADILCSTPPTRQEVDLAAGLLVANAAVHFFLWFLIRKCSGALESHELEQMLRTAEPLADPQLDFISGGTVSENQQGNSSTNETAREPHHYRIDRQLVTYALEEGILTKRPAGTLLPSAVSLLALHSIASNHFHPSPKLLLIARTRGDANRLEVHKRTMRALKAKIINRIVVHRPSPAIEGMVQSISHMVSSLGLARVSAFENGVFQLNGARIIGRGDSLTRHGVANIVGLRGRLLFVEDGIYSTSD